MGASHAGHTLNLLAEFRNHITFTCVGMILRLQSTYKSHALLTQEAVRGLHYHSLSRQHNNLVG